MSHITESCLKKNSTYLTIVIQRSFFGPSWDHKLASQGQCKRPPRMTDVTSVASAHTLLSFRLTFSRHQLIGWVAFLNDAKLHTICPWRYVGICLTRIIKAFSWVSTSGNWQISVKITLHKLSGQFKVIAVRSHPTGQMGMRLWRPEIGLPDGSAGRESACSSGDPGWIPELGSSPREGTGYPLQYSWAPLGLRW